MSQFAPNFTAVYGSTNAATASAAEYVDISADGYIVAKKATSGENKVYITADLPEANLDDTTKTLKITIEEAAG